jgi:hypothetical protein
MNIQKFATLDEVKDLYKDNINKTSLAIQQSDDEYQKSIDDYNKNYDNQLNEYNNLLNQQQDYIDNYAKTQDETIKKQTDYNIGVINQNKQQAAKDTASETGEAYMDYMRNINQYGGNSENRATNGISNAGVSNSIQAAFNITYQNRIGTAKAALQKANVSYDNQIQEALLNNDTKLAENALTKMQKSYELALSGFEYKNNLYNNKLSYTKSLNDSNYSRKSDLQSKIDNYTNAITNIDQYQEESAQKRQQLAYERQQQAESNRQWWANFNENKRQYEKNFNAEYGNDDFNDNYETVTSTYTPFLSSKTALDWFNNGISKISSSGIKINDLKSRLTEAYNEGTINESDVAKILKSFGLS